MLEPIWLAGMAPAGMAKAESHTFVFGLATSQPLVLAFFHFM